MIINLPAHQSAQLPSVIETRMEMLAQQADALTRQAQRLREQAEKTYRQICCGGACNQGHECPLEGLK